MLSKLSSRELFLVDGVGAIVTALLLSLLLARYESVFGMPVPVLYALAEVATGLAVYALLCYKLLRNIWRPYLKGIAAMNTLYCFATALLVIKHYASLTWLGMAYFIVEIGIILTLVKLELKMANAVFR